MVHVDRPFELKNNMVIAFGDKYKCEVDFVEHSRDGDAVHPKAIQFDLEKCDGELTGSQEETNYNESFKSEHEMPDPMQSPKLVLVFHPCKDFPEGKLFEMRPQINGVSQT